jgi:N4-(beta-N-acetylglucosaminyl)-L-asparaginase
MALRQEVYSGVMSREISRRGLLAAVGATVAAPAIAGFPNVVLKGQARPVVVASANGHQYRNGGDRTCVELAFERMMRGDDVLDALIAGVNIVELDPADTSVGFGGLPNGHGVVQLDSCCMHGPKKRAGGVASLEGVRTPSNVAQMVMDLTDHHLLVGKGAQEFARNMGFKIEDDLNTDTSRRAWLEWKRRTDPQYYPPPANREIRGMSALESMIEDGWVDPEHAYGTINCDGVNAQGHVCGVTTTSGLAFKIPGRVGDSPILGAGLYVDGSVGAAGSTGRGEANLYNLSSYLIVEEMRRGKHPKDAGMEALRRIRSNTIERRLLNDQGEPSFNINFYIINARGEHAGVAMRSGPRYAVCTEQGPELVRCEALLG